MLGRTAAAVLAFAMLVLIAGCGSSDSSSSDTSLSKAEYIAQGDAICKDASRKEQAAVNKVVVRLEKSGEDITQKVGGEKLVVAALGPLAVMSKELQALGMPEEGEAEAQAMIRALKKAVAEGEESAANIIDGTEPFQLVKQLASEYGFHDCSNF